MIGDIDGKGGYTYRLSPDIRTVTIVDGPQNVGKTYRTDSPVGRAILAEINGFSSTTIGATLVLSLGAAIAFGFWVDARNKADQRRAARRRRIARPRRR